jgi:hypothetical protein
MRGDDNLVRLASATVVNDRDHEGQLGKVRNNDDAFHQGFDSGTNATVPAFPS